MQELRETIEGLRGLDKFQAVSATVRRGGTLHVGGLYGSSPSFLLAALAPDVRGTLLVAAPGMREARVLHEDVKTFFGWEAAILFPPWESDVPEGGDAETLTFTRRLAVLCRFISGDAPPVVVAPVRALAQDVVPPEAVRKNTRWIRTGEDLDLQTFLPWLENRDLKRVPMAETNGEWSLRGSILDIFPYSSARPFRIELFGDTVDSIREYDPEDQMSVRRLEACRITLIQRRRFLKPGRRGQAATLLDYLGKGSVCVVVEPEKIESRVNDDFQRTGRARLPLSWEGFVKEAARFPRLFLTALPHDPGADGVDFAIRSVHRATPGIDGVLGGFRELIKKKRS